MIPLNTSFLKGTLRFLCPSEFSGGPRYKVWRFGVQSSIFCVCPESWRSWETPRCWILVCLPIDMKGGLGSCDWGGQEVPRSPVCKGESWECLQAPGEPLVCDLSRVWRSQDHESWCRSQEKESALVVFLLQWYNTVTKNNSGKRGLNLLLLPHLSPS